MTGRTKSKFGIPQHEKTTTLEVTLHEIPGSTPWAEWDLWWNRGDAARRIASGTGPSFLSCIDAAANAHIEHQEMFERAAVEWEASGAWSK